MMYPAGANAVRIEPVTSGFEEYEIFLSNVDMLVQMNESGVFVDAGQAADKGSPGLSVLGQSLQLSPAVSHALGILFVGSMKTNENQASPDMDSEFKNSTDHKDKAFKAGGVLGISFDVNVQAIDSLLTCRSYAVVSPSEWRTNIDAVLPCGIPIYFLVKARNSQGLETTAHCSLDNYDCTFPDGRVDADYRKIVDGQGASTVFNGNKKGQELKYTFENNHASANWDGFKDEECGIHGYTFSVGSTAVSDIIHGGDLVTTVCHSTPFVVDTSPPVLNNVNDVLFDETFRFLVVYYDATDDVSGVARMEFGLGKTKYDVAIRPYIPFEIRGKENTYLVNEEFEITDGVAAWIRLKVVNNVLIDITPPVPGNVSDGENAEKDEDFTSEAATMSASWAGFYDPESGLQPYTLTVLVNDDIQTVIAGLQELLLLSTANQAQYQQQDDVLNFTWHFKDPESGIAEYRCVVFENYQGTRSKVWPEQTDFHVIQITLARPGEVEELNDKNEVELVDKEPIWVTWKPRDVQSGIKETRLCIGLAASANCITSDTDVRKIGGSLPFTTSFHDMNLTVTTDEDQKVLYQVYIVVINGAGASSTVAASKPFYVLKANVPGVVLDGREATDVDFSNDKASIAITFSGFSSAACGITGYEWGVGTQPFITDVMPYTHFGLVVDEQGRGFAQAHIKQFEGQTYYSTVRARTGHNCHEEYIVSSSNGFALDTQAPVVKFTFDKYLVTSNQAVYQTTGREWTFDVKDLIRVSNISELYVLARASNGAEFESDMKITHYYAESGIDLVEVELLSSVDCIPGQSSSRETTIRTIKAKNESSVVMRSLTLETNTLYFLRAAVTNGAGNNHTVGIQWDVYDDISNIEGVDLYLGTKPGLDDISPRIFLKEDLRNYVFRDVTPRFQDGTVYYVTIEVKNGAGMVNETWNNFTVKMSAPDMSAVKLSLPNVTTESVAGTEVGILDNTERLELNLNLDPEQENQLDVEYYGKEVIDSNSLALGVVPNVVSFDITVAVIDLNDPPAISYVPVPNTDNITQELRVGPTVGNGVNMSVLVEANTTTTATLGVVLFGDADHNDRVEFLGHASGAAAHVSMDIVSPTLELTAARTRKKTDAEEKLKLTE
nr:hypothetical protein BaRGS_027224 [Batillaria attramentaria]